MTYPKLRRKSARRSNGMYRLALPVLRPSRGEWRSRPIPWSGWGGTEHTTISIRCTRKLCKPKASKAIFPALGRGKPLPPQGCFQQAKASPLPKFQGAVSLSPGAARFGRRMPVLIPARRAPFPMMRLRGEAIGATSFKQGATSFKHRFRERGRSL